MRDGANPTIDVLLVGGPTALIELAGLRLLTDPTFDPPGDYPAGQRKLIKTSPPARRPEEIGAVDCVLLSHDQHPDNLDRSGREFAASAPITLTTPAAAARLGGKAIGLAPWETRPLGELTVTAVPARHGPPGCEPQLGDVTGFVLAGSDLPSLYVSGDNAALELVDEIAERFSPVDVALLFAGQARTALLGEVDLTLSSASAVEAARRLRARHVVPLHFEGWAHFKEGLAELREAFAGSGLEVHFLEPGDGVSL